jgi:trehalose 6-phosphate synthase/phosphatase
MFKALKEQAITIKVNSNLSAAKYYLRDYSEARNFLKSLPAKMFISRVLNRVLNLLPNSPFSAKKR